MGWLLVTHEGLSCTIQAVRRLFNGLLGGARWFCGGP